MPNLSNVVPYQQFQEVCLGFEYSSSCRIISFTMQLVFNGRHEGFMCKFQTTECNYTVWCKYLLFTLTPNRYMFLHMNTLHIHTMQKFSIVKQPSNLYLNKHDSQILIHYQNIVYIHKCIVGCNCRYISIQSDTVLLLISQSISASLD